MIRRGALVSNIMVERSKFRRQDPIQETRQVTGCHGHPVSLSRQQRSERSAIVYFALGRLTCMCLPPLILITDACLIGFSNFHGPSWRALYIFEVLDLIFEVLAEDKTALARSA